LPLEFCKEFEVFFRHAAAGAPLRRLRSLEERLFALAILADDRAIPPLRPQANACIIFLGGSMNTSWGSEEDVEIDDELTLEMEHLIPSRQHNNGDIGTRDFYDRQDRIAREIIERPR
jgi:hypothetical protein